MLSGFSIKSIRGSGWQGQLEETLREIFPGENILSNAKKDVAIKNPETGIYLEIDVWIPNLNLCFEFQDAYHYATTWYHHDTLAEVRHKDSVKRNLAHQQGYTLIDIPYWWASDPGSLVSTIHFQRPDLENITNKNIESLTDEDAPIELNAHFGNLEDVNIPDVGELMYASFPPVNSFVQTISPDNKWWIGEKYDGIRCLWNPNKKHLYSKTAIRIPLLPRIQRHFPSTFLDGEIWYGRGMYGEAQKILKMSVEIINWALFRVVSFDVPSFATFHLPFEKRYLKLLVGVPRDHSFLTPAIRILCEDPQSLSTFLAWILDDAGEGAVLRKPASLYEHGRSSDLLKLKTTRGDREALVFDVDSIARTLKLQLPDGTYFDITADDVLYDTNPKKGDVVTFSFENYSRSVIPVRPKVFRVRTDVFWEDIVRTHIKDRAKIREDNFTSRPAGYWTSEKGKKMREFFVTYAKNCGFDPLIPQNWYFVSKSEFELVKGASSILAHFDNSLTKALIRVFPEIGLDELKFPVLPSNYLLDIRKRREAFDEHAHSNRFDPLIAENWYIFSKKVMHNSNKAISSVVNFYYNGSVASALTHLYPDVGLDRQKLLAASIFDAPEHRKQLFLEFAKEKRFDPRVPENWYSMSITSFLSKRGAREVLSYYGGSYANALAHLFPDLKLDVSKFTKENYYENEENQREFFIDIAKEMGFDPKIPENWYPLSLELVLPHKGAVIVLSRYNHNLCTALMHLFPNVAFDKDKFIPPNYWLSMKNRKDFLLNFAKEQGFDPLSPSPWYQYISLPIKGAEAMLTYYGGSLYRALIASFPNVPFDPLEFRMRPTNYWTNERNQKEFFKKVAAAHNFDPLVPSNWYSFTNADILKHRGANSLLVHFNGSFTQALLHIFPDIGLDPSKFNTPRNYWKDEKNRRKFFTDFAKQKKFDPLIPNHWYAVSVDDLASLKTCTIVRANGGSIVRTLLRTFPEIGLDQSKFSKPKL
eukprot:Phypoly_transcript_01963.p1 GENE.Phypoly_transcript_01963~~Phypoly_transcript_01963.p1  ORF type:complete len:985 (-),score=156.37 Phypoly_transcript_01963:23-2977(-)